MHREATRWRRRAGWGSCSTLAIVLPAAPRRGFLADLYLGRLANPQWLDGHIDAKMFLYLIGAVMLS